MGITYKIRYCTGDCKNSNCYKMSRRANKQSKLARKVSLKGTRNLLVSRELRKLQKSRPKRYMTPFLCFAHAERQKANGGTLLTQWRAAHRGLGAKWRALGAEKKRFKGKLPAFAMFIKDSPKRKDILPAWRKAHKGLGARWRALDHTSKAKYVAASKQLKGPYEQQMKIYSRKRMDLIKSIGIARRSNKVVMKQRKQQVIKRKKAKAVSSKNKKVVPRKSMKARIPMKVKQEPVEFLVESARKVAKPTSGFKNKKVKKQKRVKKTVAMAVPK